MPGTTHHGRGLRGVREKTLPLTCPKLPYTWRRTRHHADTGSRAATRRYGPERRLGEREILREAIEEIARESARCRGIVRSLIPLDRDEDREIRVEDLNAIARRACERSRGRAGLRSATLVCELRAEDARVVAEPVQLEQALLEIIGNAVASREAGARVDVTVRGDGDRLRIGILDDGEGIPPERLEQIIEPGSTIVRPEVAGGLGLARSIVARHRGRIEILSEVGAGTLVTVELPAQRGAGDTEYKRLVEVA